MKAQHPSGKAVAPLLALLLLLQPVSGYAQQAGAFGEQHYPFTDLPGVVTGQEDQAADAVVCSQRFDSDKNLYRRFGEPSRPVYTCTQNGRSFSSERPPISRERDLRGLGW